MPNQVTELTADERVLVQVLVAAIVRDLRPVVRGGPRPDHEVVETHSRPGGG